MKGKIRVFCRLRPLNDKELSLEEKNIVCSPDEFTIAHPWKDDKSKQHIYDRVFDANTTQEEVFEDTKVKYFKMFLFFVDIISNINMTFVSVSVYPHLYLMSCVFFCVSSYPCFFWVYSSLAYANLLGTKGYVVVLYTIDFYHISFQVEG